MNKRKVRAIACLAQYLSIYLPIYKDLNNFVRIIICEALNGGFRENNTFFVFSQFIIFFGH